MLLSPSKHANEVLSVLKSNQLDADDLAAVDARSVQEKLFARGHECLHTVVTLMRQSGGSKVSTQAKAHLKFALLCDAMLHAHETERRKPPLKPAIVEAVIINVLEAMVSGNAVARDRFPRLLELIAAYPDTQATFKTHVREFSKVILLSVACTEMCVSFSVIIGRCGACQCGCSSAGYRR